MACSRNSDMKYEWKLQLAIQEIFVKYIKPQNVLPYFGKHGEHLLIQRDYQEVTAVTTQQGDMAGASLLLDRLCVYKGWYECLMKVLRDPEVKLSHVAGFMDNAKSSLNSRLQQIKLDGGNPDEESFHDHGVQAGLEHKPDDVKPKTSELTETKDSRTELTDSLHIELRNVDQRIVKLRSEHEAKVKLLEQENERLSHNTGQYERRIKQLEQEKEKELRCFQDQVRELKKEKETLEELIRQERKHQRDQINLHREKISELKDEARDKDQLIENLRNTIGNLEMERKRWGTAGKKEISDLLSATQDNDGVIVFNYWVMYRMRRQHPDLAKKYKIQEWRLPSHLQNTAVWYVIWSLYEGYSVEVMQGGLTAAKEIIQTKLREILNKVNMRKEKAMNEDLEKFDLQWDIISFFSSCYSCLIGLQGHNINELQNVIQLAHQFIKKDLGTIVNSNWADIMSKDTYTKGWKAECWQLMAKT